MSLSAEQYVIIRTRAERRARKKYPNQLERAREMIDSECGEYNGPYTLEPLTLWQRLMKLFD